MISLTKDVLVRGFDNSTHSDLGKKSDQMGVSINSIIKDAVEQWLDKKTQVPHIHDLLIYSDEKSMNNFLKSLDRMTSGTEWFKSFTFKEDGFFSYTCTIHPWVERSITVLEPGVEVSKDIRISYALIVTIIAIVVIIGGVIAIINLRRRYLEKNPK